MPQADEADWGWYLPTSQFKQVVLDEAWVAVE
jgi:hypothetical protein